MSGIFYLQNKVRAENKQKYVNQHGVLLTDATLYNLDSVNLLDSNIGNTKEWVRQLRGEYSFLYETDQHIVFGTDQFGQKPLYYFYDKDNRKFGACSNPFIVEQNYGKFWRAISNKIYILNKDTFQISVETNTKWNLKQIVKNYDEVFSIFEESVRLRHIEGNTTYSLSGGIDSGAIHCAAKKLCDDVTSFTEISNLSDRDKSVLKKRLDKNHKFFKDPDDEEIFSIREEIIAQTIDCNLLKQNDTNSKINYLRKLDRNHIITGLGGDALYGLFIEKTQSNVRTSANISFPNDLHLVFPWHEHADRLCLALNQIELIAKYFRKQIKNPLLDQRLFQAWLNTSASLKNKRYKDWMKLYMDEHNYAY